MLKSENSHSCYLQSYHWIFMSTCHFATLASLSHVTLPKRHSATGASPFQSPKMRHFAEKASLCQCTTSLQKGHFAKKPHYAKKASLRQKTVISRKEKFSTRDSSIDFSIFLSKVTLFCRGHAFSVVEKEGPLLRSDASVAK